MIHPSICYFHINRLPLFALMGIPFWLVRIRRMWSIDGTPLSNCWRANVLFMWKSQLSAHIYQFAPNRNVMRHILDFRCIQYVFAVYAARRHTAFAGIHHFQSLLSSIVALIEFCLICARHQLDITSNKLRIRAEVSKSYNALNPPAFLNSKWCALMGSLLR